MTSNADQSTPIARRKPGVRRSGATDRVTDALREAIVSLELPPGAMLDKAVLTARFGVSRFPISEALNRLKAEGLVEVRPQSGSRVSLLRLADVHENLFLRRALEAEVVETLAGGDNAGLIAELKRNLRYQKAAVDADDRQGFHRLDIAFHGMLVSAVSYPRVHATVEHAWLALDRVRRLLGSPRRLALTFDEHVRVVDALETGDPQEVRAAMVAHLDAVTAELEAFSQDHPDVFADSQA
ncbi:GntR family transcriptional regulator [Kaustia mangrovi]|uniref:GntR family transcriptional regulator n=1 Tax=Kaustia mangrovi TaxID=2593653 RepID=A0A7S8C7Z1_9HYPH|nr:GntR family transcriptional regulator [Kaustia mangrovi]QPC44966.1 GntR family transcriptional regulator [Kaustia mangrovi]